MRTLFRWFRQDKPFALVTLAAALVCLAPLAATSIPPLMDLPHHVGLSALLWDAIFGQGSAREHYVINTLPTPYWTVYVLLGIAIRTLGVYVGTNVIVALCMLSVPLGVMRLLIAFGKSPRLGVLAFLTLWDFNLYFGWLNHVLGLGIAFFALAELIEAKTPRDAVWVWPWGVVLALTHVLPFGYFGLMACFVTLLRPEPRKQAFAMFATAISLPVLALVPWLRRSFQTRQPGTDPGFNFEPLFVKLRWFFDYSLGWGHVSPEARWMATGALVTLVLVPLVLLFLERKAARRVYRLAAIPFFVAALLYLTLPMSVARPVEHWGTYPRFATPMLLGLLFLPNPEFTGKRRFLALPALVAVLGLSGVVLRQFRAFDAALEPFYEIVKRVPRGAKLLPLCYQNKFPLVRSHLGESLHGYIVGNAGAFDPYLFNQLALPIGRKDLSIPGPAAWGRRPALFSMEKHGRFYDYILVQGSAFDPLKWAPPTDKHLEIVFEQGIYRLYAVR